VRNQSGNAVNPLGHKAEASLGTCPTRWSADDRTQSSRARTL